MRKHFKFIENITYETGSIFKFELCRHFFYNLFRLFILQLRGKSWEVDLKFFLQNGLDGYFEDVETLKECLKNFPSEIYLTELDKAKGMYKIHLFFSTNKGFCYATVDSILYEIV